MRGDRVGVERATVGEPALVELTISSHPRALIEAAERGKAAGVELLAHLGFDVNHRDVHTALHVAAYTGNRELCELLLRLGADPTLRDDTFDAPAAGWGRHARHEELAAWLEQQAAEHT